MNSFRDSYFARALQAVARAVRRFPRGFIYPQILLFALCVGYTWHGLKVDLDRDNLVGGDKRFHRDPDAHFATVWPFTGALRLFSSQLYSAMRRSGRQA